jgi:hypothetical protein
MGGGGGSGNERPGRLMSGILSDGSGTTAMTPPFPDRPLIRCQTSRRPPRSISICPTRRLPVRRLPRADHADQPATYLPRPRLADVRPVGRLPEHPDRRGNPVAATPASTTALHGTFGLAMSGSLRRSLRSMPMMGGVWGLDDFIYMLGLLPQPGNSVNVAVINTNSTTVSASSRSSRRRRSVLAGTACVAFLQHPGLLSLPPVQQSSRYRRPQKGKRCDAPALAAG